MIEELLASNRAWADGKVKVDPDFFARLVAQQSPEYLWVGCSDSRVPANDIVGRDPGEMFVHRNVANLCTPGDLNFLSVLQYSVEVLKVRRILVVGHYGCGGVLASLNAPENGLVDHWIDPIRQLAERHKAELVRAGRARAPRPPGGAERPGTGAAGQREPHHRERPPARPGRGRPRLGLFPQERPDHRPARPDAARRARSRGSRGSSLPEPAARRDARQAGAGQGPSADRLARREG